MNPNADESLNIDPVAVGGRVADAVAALTVDALRAAPARALPVVDLARATAAEVERVSAGSPDVARRACRAGCDACCRLAVSITAPEAIWIAHELRVRSTVPKLADIRARVARTSARVSHLTIEQRAGVRVACALLAPDGACSIHAFRPLGCRGWTSFSREACDAALAENRPGHDGPMDRIGLAAASAGTEGLLRGIAATGRAGETYEFHAALLRVLDDPDGAARWPGSPDVLAGCPRVRSDRLR